ncbi:MAG: hypothetical protein HWN66_07400 [Candidatus Helarchaeota archaeon]|nr:hypothetical protein [Candidatus Helarchaeota archaeon]
MKNGKQIIQQLQSRKKILIQQMKDLNREESDKKISKEEYEQKKYEIERELVEIMDRLTQLAYISKN